jgi:ferritin heavy chain
LFLISSGSPDDGGALNDIKFIDMKPGCTAATKDQIKMEITAALQYMKMANHFAQDKVNRPGFAKFFFAAASEERGHAYKLIEYLSMRGQYIVDGKTLPNIDISGLVRDPKVDGVDLAEIDGGLTALQNALKLEVKVTQSIRNLVKKCEGDEVDKFNHYHVS